MQLERYKDRRHAGMVIAAELAHLAERRDVVVLALPRGGVPVAYEVARALRAPLDVFVVRKLGVPWQEELAMGAIASGNVRVVNRQVVSELGLREEDINAVAEREKVELERRERAYRGGRPAPDIRGKTVILVDDGVATGTTMRAALQALKQLGPTHVIVAVGVAPTVTVRLLEHDADEVVCPLQPAFMYAISPWFDRFGQTSDDEVRELLSRARAQEGPAAAPPT
ncbi:MAG: phosphoribosyltransferase [Myxococcota bacterium]